MPELTEWLFERSVALRIPRSVHVDLTMRCNERCIHCYRVIEQRPELTTQELKGLLDDVARAGTLYLTFSGGEVFLRKDLFELVEHARRLHFDVRLKSNALLVTPEKAARLRTLGVRQVDISIYSADPAVHDRVTKIPGSLERSLQGAVMLRDADVTVKLNCPLMKQNVGQYKDIRALAERLGILCGFDPMITAKNDGDRSPSFFAVIIGSKPQRMPSRSASARMSLYCPTFCFMRGQFSLTVTPASRSMTAP